MGLSYNITCVFTRMAMWNYTMGRPCDDGGRDWSSVAAIGEWQIAGKPPWTRKRQGRIPSDRGWSYWHPWFWTWAFFGAIHFCCFNITQFVILLGNPTKCIHSPFEGTKQSSIFNKRTSEYSHFCVGCPPFIMGITGQNLNPHLVHCRQTAWELHREPGLSCP